MAIFDEIGYLEADYLVDPYYEGTAFFETLMQVGRQVGELKTIQAQAERRIDSPVGVSSQVERFLFDKLKTIKMQSDRVVFGDPKILRMQADRRLGGVLKTINFEVSAGGLKQGDCSHKGYLNGAYLDEPYLTAFVCVDLPMQVRRQPQQVIPTLSQIDRKIDSSKTFKAQVERRIDDSLPVLMQVEARKSKTINMQVRKVLYNTFNIRILWDFASRGTNNWTVTTGSQAPGDFSVMNLNTDIVEQTFRSVGTTNVTVRCDTQISGGVYVDTIGILNHNLRSSGQIVVEGSQSPSFTNTVNFTLYPDGTNNIIYIAPTIPLQPYRYWRFSISDNGNPDGYLSVGAIVFGSAAIFQGENIVDTVTKTQKHFADKIITEGFTSVSNDRALKNSVAVEFRNLDYDKENYAMLRQIFEYCRTSMKALWIPTPRNPTRFGVFGKIASLPSEQHQSFGEGADYVNLSIEIDESL